MHEIDTPWLWFVDDAPLQALLQSDGDLVALPPRPATSPALVRAISAHLDGRCAEAVDTLRDALSSGGKDTELFLFLGQMLFESGDYEQAAAVFQQLIEAHPDHPTAHFNRAVCLEKLSRWSEAALCFRDASSNPDLPVAFLGMGLCLLHERNPEPALAAFEAFLQSCPEHVSGLFGKAVALQMLRRFSEAEAIYSRFDCESGDSPELLANLLALAAAKKDSAAVASLSARLERLRPASRQSCEIAVLAVLSSGDWPAALAQLSKLRSAGPLPPDWAYALAWCQFRTGAFDAASTTLSDLLTAIPTHGEAHLLSAAIAERDSPSAAIAHYSKAAQTLPRPDIAWWHLARLHAALGDSAGCSAAAATLAESGQLPAESAFASGLAHLLGGHAAAAASDFRAALDLRPSWLQAHWNLGLALLAGGDVARAADSLRKGRGALAESAPPEPLVAALLDAGDPDSALAEYHAAANPAAFSPELLFNLALALHRRGSLDSAELLYTRAINASPSFPEAHINLGHLMLAAGRPAEARLCWQNAQQLTSSTDSLPV